jgi:hypothetical protein
MKELISGIAVCMTFLAYIPYYKDILKGKTHPHVYSWSLWSFLTFLLVALQIKGGAGPATWITAAAGLMCTGVVIFSIKDGKKDITLSDKIVAVLSLCAMGFWLIANQPTISVMLVIAADMLAFIPTVRKSYYDPHSETLSLYATNALRFFLALAAVESYTFLSTAWIVAWALGNGLFSIMLYIRQKQVKA